MQKIIQQGAEAVIYLQDNLIIKDRIPKSYRLKKLDESIRKKRTKSEKKLLEKASKIINSPLPLNLAEKNSTKITLPFINGKKLSEHLDNLENKKEVCIKIGESIAKLHDSDIIHGDLTTSNIILSKDGKVWFIDFGLGFHSRKIEDKAVDLHLIKQALEAKHFSNFESHWKNITTGYQTSKNSQLVLERLKKVESRGRYKDKY
jgi:Kae1-associated kinase Bud32